MGWNYFEMRGKFCIRSAKPDGAAPLLRGLHSSAVPAERSNGRFACGGHSLRAGAFLFGVETFLKLLAQFYTRGLLDMRMFTSISAVACPVVS